MNKTITFDPAVYKLVPVEPNEEMDRTATAEPCWQNMNPPPDVAYRNMLAAVPDQLQGVVVHSGEPVGEVIETDKLCRGFIIEEVPAGTKLFTHPAPSQPAVETPEDLTPHLRQYLHNDGSGFVCGYDKAGIDREFAYLRAKAFPRLKTADDLIAWLDTLYSTDGNAITNQKWEPAQKAIAALLASQPSAEVLHDSDCPVHNGPACPAGPCTCKATRDQLLYRIAELEQQPSAEALVQSQPPCDNEHVKDGCEQFTHWTVTAPSGLQWTGESLMESFRNARSATVDHVAAHERLMKAIEEDRQEERKEKEALVQAALEAASAELIDLYDRTSTRNISVFAEAIRALSAQQIIKSIG